MRGKMPGKLLLLFLVETSATRCDEATTAQVAEGNFGQSGVFNWLGMLKVVSYENKKWITALTGIVLVKPKHVLANADDIVKIPQHVFERDTKAMFVPAKGAEWTVQPKSYSTHPEYEYSTVNTIAIVELDVEDVNDFPLNPICLPSSSFNTSKYLYLTGFTDEHQVLQKVIYKIQYLEQNVCDEFYNRAGIGFGVRGPGCAAPARFIDLFPYLPWITSTTTELVEMYDTPDFRRTVEE
ncbi:unnamed protein product [Spodoptera littoralis]|uniref:Peptidase S1 domain-containing protein n=1 Tax=Spodoptera littoralis TaxID=7109 RepID=A0A9P0N552_SPOLI|nr:unnamed protein product [Spodoptera littoralis]CAH1641913.1 unnamed protein product [Spodoptera littoralis]